MSDFGHVFQSCTPLAEQLRRAGVAGPSAFLCMLGRLGQVLLFALSMALGVLVPALIVRWDLKGLTGERLARSWPDASMWLAVVVFGPLSVPVHFVRTRRSWAGLGLAALWLVGALALVVLPVEALARIFGIEE